MDDQDISIEETELAQESNQQDRAKWVTWFKGNLIAVIAVMISLVALLLSKDSNDLMRKCTVASQRAYVLEENFFWEPTPEDKEEEIAGWHAKVRFKNSGLTPARSIRARAKVIITNGELSDLQKLLKEDVDTEKFSMMALAADASATANGDVVRIKDLEKVKRGEMRMYIYGWIEYDDIFPWTKRHRKEFCSEEFVSGDLLERTEDHFKRHAYKMYNGMDEECVNPIQTRSNAGK